MWDLMCPVAGIWQAAGATAGLQRPPMRNWSDNYSRENHFHDLITLDEKKKNITRLKVSGIWAECESQVCVEGALPHDGSHRLHCYSVHGLNSLFQNLQDVAFRETISCIIKVPNKIHDPFFYPWFAPCNIFAFFGQPIYTLSLIRFVCFNKTMGDLQSPLSDFNLLRLVDLCHVGV